MPPLQTRQKYLEDWIGLTGDLYAPLIPNWWAQNLGTIEFEVHFYKGHEKRAVMLSAFEAAQNRLMSSDRNRIDFENTFDSLGDSIVANKPNFMEAPIANPELVFNENMTIEDLPFARKTREKIFSSELAINLNTFGEIPISYFLELGFTWFQIIEISCTFAHWLNWIDLLPFVPSKSTRESLDEIATDFISELIREDGHRISDEWVEHIKSRFGWGVEIKTLQEIGDSFGVTRERVRQITERPMTPRIQRVWPLPIHVSKTYESFLANYNFLGFGSASSNLEVLEGWSPEGLSSLLENLGYPELSREIFRCIADSEIEYEQKLKIRKHRSGIGFFNLKSLRDHKDSFYPVEEAVRLVESTYARTFRSGDWMLAGGESLTIAESTVGRQFTANHPLSKHDIWEGLDRVRRNKGYEPLPNLDVVIELLQQAGAISEVNNDYCSGPKVPLEGLKAWLVQTLKNAPGQVMHQHQLFRESIEAGFNSSSLVLYLTYEPTIRKIQNGLIALVGAQPTENLINSVLRVASLQDIESSLDYKIESDGSINLTIILGSQYYFTGVFYAPSTLSKILDPSGYRLACCDDYVSEGKIKIKDSLWYGFQPLISHMQIKHKIKEGAILKFKLKGDRMSNVLIEIPDYK